MSPIAQLFINLALSIAIEGVLAFALFRSPRFCYDTLLCNLLTNPLVNLLVMAALRLRPDLYWPILILLEIAVVFVEAYLYRLLFDMPNKRALAVSLLVNAVSYGAGVIFWNLMLSRAR